MFFKDYVVKQIYTLFIIIFIQHSLGPDLQLWQLCKTLYYETESSWIGRLNCGF